MSLPGTDKRPAVGAMLNCGERLGPCRVLKVHPAGTLDVERLTDGTCYRLTGLPWGRSPKPEKQQQPPKSGGHDGA
ncbi:MAG TPA: hypothetical protein VFB71_12290 [Ramlibacter sp.]|nr:hypothetical protein [Ramlibacter sp.]